MTKYFLICASRDHVLKGIEGGFAQAGHGRKESISKPSKGDWVVFYSSKDIFENGKPLQKFTAHKSWMRNLIKKLSAKTLNPTGEMWNLRQLPKQEIRPLLEQLSFIKNKKKWGFYLISGFREIPEEDFSIIKNAMLGGE